MSTIGSDAPDSNAYWQRAISASVGEAAKRGAKSMRTTPVSQQQRQEILALLSNGLDNQAIAAEVGVSAGQVAAIKAHVTMGTYSAGNGGDDTPDAEGEVLSAVDGMGFALERALRDNIEQLEARLTITD